MRERRKGEGKVPRRLCAGRGFSHDTTQEEPPGSIPWSPPRGQKRRGRKGKNRPSHETSGNRMGKRPFRRDDVRKREQRQNASRSPDDGGGKKGGVCDRREKKQLKQKRSGSLWRRGGKKKKKKKTFSNRNIVPVGGKGALKDLGRPAHAKECFAAKGFAGKKGTSTLRERNLRRPQKRTFSPRAGGRKTPKPILENFLGGEGVEWVLAAFSCPYEKKESVLDREEGERGNSLHYLIGRCGQFIGGGGGNRGTRKSGWVLRKGAVMYRGEGVRDLSAVLVGT